MKYRYYAQASIKRTFKGLTVIAEAFNEIEPANTMDEDDPAVFTSYSLEYQDQDGNAIAEYNNAGFIWFWHDPKTGELLIDVSEGDSELTDLEGNPIEAEGLARIKSLVGSEVALSHLVGAAERALFKNKKLVNLAEAALKDFEAELKEEAAAC